MSNPLSNCCQSIYTTPITREKLFIIGGGILGTILVVGILVAIFSGGEDGNGHQMNGSDVLKYVPLIVGQNDLAKNIKELSKNHLDQFDFNNFDKSKSTGWSTCKSCKTDLTHLKNGMVGSQVWSLHSDCPSAYKDAVSITLEEIDVMRRLIAKYSDNITFVQDSKGLEGSFSNGKLTGSIAVKGGHTIDGRLGVLRSYYNLGVRFLSLSDGCEDAVQPVFPSPPWYSDATGLNDFGKKVVGELNRLGIVIDLSKLSKPVQLSVLAATTSPVIVYGNALTKCSDKNNVDDDVLAKLKDNGGVILVSFDPTLVVGSEKKQDAKLSDLLTHIIYLKDKIGAEHIGIGGGFDGFEGEIKDLEDPSKIPVLFNVLFNNTDEKVRWSRKELEGLAGNNLLNVLHKVEENAAELQKKNSPCEDYDVKDDYKDVKCYSDFDKRF